MEYIEITDYLKAKLKEIKSLCTTYVRNMSNTGLRNLIYSLIEQKKAHLEELADLECDEKIAQVSLPEADVRRYLDSIGDFSAFDPQMKLMDFLGFIERRLHCFQEFYAFMAEWMPNGDTAFIFHRLEEEDRKEAALIRDRCELLNLSS